jgi:inorganic pyrophosphatase
LPLVANAEKQTYHMVVEIPRGTNAKLEISTGEAENPIKQDIKNGKLRFVADVAGFKGYFANYGAFPRVCCILQL